MALEYDGSGFCGWQSQRSGGSVQDALEAALSKIADGDIRVVTAGRTDAGVHAVYQVVHFDTQAQRPETAWVRGVNALLPDSIAVRWASRMPDDFHARYCAIERRYLYLLLNSSVRPGLYHHKMGWFHQALDLASMQAAARLLLGEHDFSAFRAAECQAKSPIRTLTKIDITRQDDVIAFELRANAFLHHMVRNILGCLIYVGKRKYPPEWIREVLTGRRRSDAAPTFPAAGLYLAGVSYDDKWKLPRFAEPPLAAVLSATGRLSWAQDSPNERT
ncbi:tRNA pseudouridine38-40 synthase [Nitrosovibrio tenuis]|uniref:tRNA pseudouridine synthase A n=1 Tax=Nitrosovibrio tenuis TaxID=1233 RepID=A0A1H7MRL9_9PROT|nr:tRNA pseudouridine38-40 synthase [Nitrosovibrio tenuis]